MELEQFVNPRFQYAVIGATKNTEKYGYRVLKDLDGAGFHVVGVNPKYREIDGVPVYSTVAEVPGKIDVAIFVIPPEVGLLLLPQIEERNITHVWFQPGAENDEIEQAVNEAGLTMNDPGTCIMVARKQVRS